MISNRFTPEEVLELAKRYTREYHNAHGYNGDLPKLYYDTTAGWNATPELIAEQGSIYIYADKVYYASGGSVTSASMKIGDGTSYLIDMPFIDELISQEIMERISMLSGLVTDEERRFWNNKVTAYVMSVDQENLVLSNRNYVTDGDIYYG